MPHPNVIKMPHTIVIKMPPTNVTKLKPHTKKVLLDAIRLQADAESTVCGRSHWPQIKWKGPIFDAQKVSGSRCKAPSQMYWLYWLYFIPKRLVQRQFTRTALKSNWDMRNQEQIWRKANLGKIQIFRDKKKLRYNGSTKAAQWIMHISRWENIMSPSGMDTYAAFQVDLAIIMK
jgi:hypothetical protein